MDPLISKSTVREYSNRAVDDKEITSLLEAAMGAPSAGDERPWHFVIIRDEDLKSRIQDILPEAFMVTQAPASILLCGDQNKQKHPGFWVLDCAASTQSLLDEAQRLGLGAIWIAVYPIDGRVESLGGLLDIPRHVIPFALVVVGHPAEARKAEYRFNSSRVHYDTWSRVGNTERGVGRTER
jgi:nitroreductase